MNNFRITLTENQEKNLRSAGFVGLANDPDGLDILFYIQSITEYLQSHNKNYTKEQYHRIETLNDIIQALSDGV